MREPKPVLILTLPTPPGISLAVTAPAEGIQKKKTLQKIPSKAPQESHTHAKRPRVGSTQGEELRLNIYYLSNVVFFCFQQIALQIFRSSEPLTFFS